MIRDKILNKLNEAVGSHHEFTAHYTLKHDPKTLHYKVMSVDGKHSKEDAEKMVKDHLAKNSHVVLHPKMGITHKPTAKNVHGLNDDYAKYKVDVKWSKPGTPRDNYTTVHVKDGSSESDIVKKAKDDLKRTNPDAKIDDSKTNFMGSGK